MRETERDNEGKTVKEETEIVREGQTVRDRDSGYQFHIKQFNDFFDILLLCYYLPWENKDPKSRSISFSKLILSLPSFMTTVHQGQSVIKLDYLIMTPCSMSLLAFISIQSIFPLGISSVSISD